MVMMPARPANGARSCFFDTTTCCCATAAFLALRSAAAPSYSAWLIACAASCLRARSKVSCDSCAAASSCCNWATASSSRNCSSSWPCFTSWPDFRLTAVTRPAASIAKSAPFAARSVPTARSEGCHGCSRALVVLTVNGAGLGMPWIMRTTSSTLMPTITAISSSTPPIIQNMRLVVLGLVVPGLLSTRVGMRGLLWVREFMAAIVSDREIQKAGIRSARWFVRSSAIAKIKKRTSCPHSWIKLWLPASYLGIVLPAAAKRGVQRGGVGQPGGARLDQRDASLLVAALGVEQVEIAGGADLVLLAGQPELLRCRAFRTDLRGQSLCVVFERLQGIGDVLEGDQHGLLPVRQRLVQAGAGGALLVQQLAAVEQRLGQAQAQRPGARAGGKQLAGMQRLRTAAGGQRDLRQHRRGGHADLGGGGVQLGRGGADIRALLDQARRQADRNVPRQGDRVEPQWLQLQLRRRGAEVGGQLVAGGGESRAQRRQARFGAGQLGAYGERVGQRFCPDLLLLFGDVQAPALAAEDLLGGVQLFAQRGFLQ